MTAPTFTCDLARLADLSWRLTAEEGRHDDADLIDAARRDIDQFAAIAPQVNITATTSITCSPAEESDDQFAGEGEGSPSHATLAPESPSPVPAAPSLVERLRDIPKPDLLGTHSADCWQWHEHCARLEAADRIEELEAPVDLASDDRLIHLPGGRIAVAAQDLRAGDVVSGEPVKDVYGGILTHFGCDIDTLWPRSTLVLLDEAAES